MKFFNKSTYTLTVSNETDSIALITVLMEKAHSPRKHEIIVDKKATGDIQQLKRQSTTFLINCGTLALAVDMDKDDFRASHQVLIKSTEVHFDDAAFTPDNFPISVREKQSCDQLKLDHEHFIDVQGARRKPASFDMGQVPRVSITQLTAATQAASNIVTRAEEICFGSGKNDGGFEVVQRIPSYTVIKLKLTQEFGGEVFDKHKSSIKMMLERLHVKKLPKTIELVNVKTNLPSRNASVLPPPFIQILTKDQIEAQFGVSLNQERKMLKEYHEKISSENKAAQEKLDREKQAQADKIEKEKREEREKIEKEKKEQHEKTKKEARERQAKIVQEARERRENEEREAVQKAADEAQQRVAESIRLEQSDLSSLSEWVASPNSSINHDNNSNNNNGNTSNNTSNNNDNSYQRYSSGSYGNKDNYNNQSSGRSNSSSSNSYSYSNNNNNNDDNINNNNNTEGDRYSKELDELDTRMRQMGFQNFTRDNLLHALTATNGNVNTAIKSLM